MSDTGVYRVQFVCLGKIYEIYARSVGQGSLLGFVEVEEIVFGETSQVVVDPSEDSLRHEFKGVTRTYLPMHAVLRIDRVEKAGTGRITKGPEGGGTLTPFPSPLIGGPKTD